MRHVRCGCSSSGRAPPCQGGGSEFEPRHPLHKDRFRKETVFFIWQFQRREPSEILPLGKMQTSHVSLQKHLKKKVKNSKIGIDISENSGIIPLVRCGCSSSGRAPPCQGGGSEFEPRHPLHKRPRFCVVFFFYLIRLEQSIATVRWTVARDGLTERNNNCLPPGRKCNRASSPAP